MLALQYSYLSHQEPILYNLGIGPKGQKDYSKWTFLVIPKYTTIKEGTNKITSKFSCSNKPNLVSYYSLNVTGLVGAGGSFSHAPAHITNNARQIATPLP